MARNEAEIAPIPGEDWEPDPQEAAGLEIELEIIEEEEGESFGDHIKGLLAEHQVRVEMNTARSNRRSANSDLLDVLRQILVAEDGEDYKPSGISGAVRVEAERTMLAVLAEIKLMAEGEVEADGTGESQ